MSKTDPNQEAEAIAQAEKKSNQLKSKIINGSITKEETQELYNAFKNITPDSNIATSVNKLCNDVYKDAGPDKFHSFVKQLVEVEKDKVSKAFSIPDDPEQVKSAQIKRGADFYRTASLARNAMIFECTKEGLGKEAFEALSNNDLAKGAKALSEIKIPDRVKDTYKSVDEFYKENKLETGAARNLTFHAINVAIQQMGEAEGASHPERTPQEQKDKQAKLQRDLNSISTRGVFHKETPGSLDLIKAQIEGKEPTTQQIENSKAITQKVQKEIEQNKTIKQDSPNPTTKTPGFFDKVKAFANKVLDNIVPGRKKLNQMLDESKKQTNNLHQDNKGINSEAKPKSPPVPSRVTPPLQTPTVKSHQQQHKGNQR